ncbi:esterase-like activity of phytase family protein [Ramlibacter albus]|uniref:Esterase-like activity of phytase family protein n=1 Tax=Ramlibacter albus TaxID=2079448 RepID=A0A923M6B4_9BURK|nr:esterase-like activity of phytase family protein [Ramlibacter albus]MBC5763514.1 esterase-like activity of phytase family protein [Ramlibacter albus]
MTSLLLTRRTLLRATGAAATLAAAGCMVPSVTSAPPKLKLIGEATLPHRMKFKGTTVGGLSGIDYDTARNLWIALSDDRSEIDPARFYTFDLQLSPGQLQVTLKDVHTLRQSNGQPFPGRRQGGDVPDPEAVRWLPNGNVLWTSEGDGAIKLSPWIREARADGSHVREFELPPMFRFGGTAGTGPRNNVTFEGLALTPDARGAWVAMENALEQDGGMPTVESGGGACRFTLFDVASGRATRQIAYQPDPIPARPIPPGSFADNGVSEVLMDGEHHMLVLERAFMMGRGTSLRVYRIDVREGSDTLAVASLSGTNVRMPRKTLIADFAQLGLSRLDNTEGMCWGPRLANGARTLVFVSDDNFNPLQVTQFAACEYLG